MCIEKQFKARHNEDDPRYGIDQHMARHSNKAVKLAYAYLTKADHPSNYHYGYAPAFVYCEDWQEGYESAVKSLHQPPDKARKILELQQTLHKAKLHTLPPSLQPLIAYCYERIERASRYLIAHKEKHPSPKRLLTQARSVGATQLIVLLTLAHYRISETGLVKLLRTLQGHESHFSKICGLIQQLLKITGSTNVLKLAYKHYAKLAKICAPADLLYFTEFIAELGAELEGILAALLHNCQGLYFYHCDMEQTCATFGAIELKLLCHIYLACCDEQHPPKYRAYLIKHYQTHNYAPDNTSS
jgi:hypothetical protein